MPRFAFNRNKLPLDKHGELDKLPSKLPKEELCCLSLPLELDLATDSVFALITLLLMLVTLLFRFFSWLRHFTQLWVGQSHITFFLLL